MMSVLPALRNEPRRRLTATGVAVGIGLALATVHWSGLLLAGALVGLLQRSLRRAIAAGVALGGLIVGSFLAQFVLTGTLGPVLVMGQPPWLAVAIGLALPAFGSLIRGVV